MKKDVVQVVQAVHRNVVLTAFLLSYSEVTGHVGQHITDVRTEVFNESADVKVKFFLRKPHMHTVGVYIMYIIYNTNIYTHTHTHTQSYPKSVVAVRLACSEDPVGLLLSGSPMSDMSKVTTQTKRNNLAVQVGAGSGAHNLTS